MALIISALTTLKEDKMKAVICPVCNGTGDYPNLAKNTLTCHGCNGKGWVEVQEDLSVIYYSPVWYPTWYPWETY